MSEDVVKVGDKIRFSVELLEQIKSSPDSHTETVFVHKITEDDGYKVIWLGREPKA